MPGEPLSANTNDSWTQVRRESPVAVRSTLNVVSVCFSDGIIYEGPLLEGKPQGPGICAFPSGIICAGNFERGFLEGPAEVLLPSGALFTGAFERSVANGSGAYLQDGRLTRGTWREGIVMEQTEDDVSGSCHAKFFTLIAIRLCDELRNVKNGMRATGRHHLHLSCGIREPMVHLCVGQPLEQDSMMPSKEAHDYFIVNPSVT
ncbi:hypothetical protein TRSC58_02554, partial [Trypanosoma rangeli SC58]